MSTPYHDRRRSSSVSTAANNHNNIQQGGDAFFDKANARLTRLESDFIGRLIPGSQSHAREPSYIPKPKNYGRNETNVRIVRSSSASIAGRSTSIQHQQQNNNNNQQQPLRRSASAGIRNSSTNADENDAHFQRLRNAALTRSDDQKTNQVKSSRSGIVPTSSRQLQLQQQQQQQQQRRGSVGSNQREIILSAQPATMFPSSSLKSLNSKKIKKESSTEQQEQQRSGGSRARSPFFVESDIHSGKTYKRVPSPDYHQQPVQQQQQHQEQQQQHANVLNLSDIQQQQQNQQHQPQEPNTARTNRSLISDSSIIFSNNERIHSPRDAHDSAFITPRAKIIIPEKDIPKHYAHIHNMREVNETKLARCLRSGFSFNTTNPSSSSFSRSASSPTKQTRFVFDDESIHVPQNHQEEQIVDEVRAYNEKWGNQFLAQKQHQQKQDENTNRARSSSAQIPSPGVIMQCFLEDPPPPTFSVAGGRKTTRSQLNFIVHNNNSINAEKLKQPNVQKNNNKSVTIIVDEKEGNNNNNNSSTIQGEGKSRVFYAAVDDDHISIAISPRGSAHNSRSTSAVNHNINIMPSARNHNEESRHDEDQNLQERERDSPPSTILSSPRYDNIDTEDLLSTSFLNTIRNTKSSNFHNGNENHPQHSHYSITSSGGGMMSANDRSVVELYTNHRSLLEATESILHFTATEYCDMYRHSFCSKEADRFTVPGHHNRNNNMKKNQNNNNNAPVEDQQQRQQLHQTLIPLGIAPNTEQRLTRRPIDLQNETDDVATDLLSPLGKSENQSSSAASPDKDEINNNKESTNLDDENNKNHNNESGDVPPESSPLMSDFPSTGKRGRNSSPISELYASPIEPKQQITNDKTKKRDPFRHHGFAIVHPQPEDLEEADPSNDPRNDISYYNVSNKNENGEQQQQNQDHQDGNSHHHHHHSPLLRRLMELHNIPPHRYAVLTVVWCSLWCTSVALDLPCIASYRRFTHDIVLPRRPSLKELQSEFFGGIAVSDASNRQMMMRPKECTIASKILSATKDFGLELVAVASEYAQREAQAYLNKYDSNKNCEGNATNANNAVFTRRSHTARLDAALLHSIRWIVEAAEIEQEERLWNARNREAKDNNANDDDVELSPESVTSGSKKSSTPEPNRDDNIPAPIPRTLKIDDEVKKQQQRQQQKQNKNQNLTLNQVLELISVKNENVDLHSLSIAKALLRWSWQLRESCLGVLEEQH